MRQLLFIYYFSLSLQPYVAEHTTERGPNLRSLLFLNSGVGSITSLKNQISESAVREDLWLFHPYPRLYIRARLSGLTPDIVADHEMKASTRQASK